MTIQIAKRIGRALDVKSATRISQLDQALREYVRSVSPAATTPLTGSIDASQVGTGILVAPRGGTGFGAFTAGDLLYANTIATLARLGIGSAGDLLRVSGGAPAWQAQSTLSIGWAQLTGIPATFTPANHLVTGGWTPTDASGAGLAFASAAGTYVAHESLVIARAAVTYPVTASGAGALMDGLPFTVFNDQTMRQGHVSYTDAAVALFSLPLAAGTRVNFYTTGGGAATNVQLSGKTVYFQVVYSK